MDTRRFVVALVGSATLLGAAVVVRATVLDPRDEPDPVANTTDQSASTLPVRSSTTDGPTTTIAPTSTEPPVPTAADVVGGYVQAIAEGRFPDAYATLCDEAQAAVTETAFVSELNSRRNQTPMRDFRITGVFHETATGAIVYVTVSYGADSPFTAQLERAAHTAPWRICVINGGYAENLVWPLALDPDGERL